VSNEELLIWQGLALFVSLIACLIGVLIAL
jgi:hypothetical protein